ncbi:MAG: dihydroneopterin triphosphate diphosphatase [Limnobacter sp.]|nr:dihydroneopterin triphosphate diphosphatase [Limnobacter sp.]
MTKPTKIPVSVLVVIYAADHRFLLIERADKEGYWQSVTGSLDFEDERPLDAAVRELAEETGIQAEACRNSLPLAEVSAQTLLEPHKVRPWPHQLQYEIFEHWRHRYPDGVTHNTEHWFYVCVPEGTQPKLAPREHVGYEWVDCEEAQKRCFSPNNAHAIADLYSHLVRKQGNINA